MSDTLDIFGKRYNNVTGIIATDSGGTELTFTRGGGTDILFTMSVNTLTETVTVTSDKTYSELVNYINVPITIDLYIDGEHSEYLSGRSYMTYADHKTFDVYGGGSSIMAIEYYSNGNIVFLEKSPMMTTLTATQNGTYTPTANLNLYDEVIVNVPTGTPRTASDLTVSGATVTVPAGLYSAQASKSVASMTLPSTTSAMETGVFKADIFPTTAMTTYLNIPVGYNSTAQFYQIRALMLDGKTITSNGTYYAGDDDLDGFSSVVVNVSSPAPSLQTKTATYTPTESQQTATITADSGYDGLSSVGVTVNAISSSYVGSGVSRRSSSDLTVSGATVTVPSGYYASQASKAVATGTAGTPTATKGSVSNHSVTVTPSVTNTSGYITGSTKTGTAVTVSASELVSGSETKTANGTYDVTNLQTLVVNVSGGSSKNAQTAQSTTRSTSTTYTEVVALTCTKAGTYNVYWSTFRSSTSGTWGSQLYINDNAYGTAQTGSWSNHIQNVHLSNVQLSANADVAVRVRSRGSNYYGYVGTLTIIEA